jgi:hypothetical protein
MSYSPVGRRLTAASGNVESFYSPVERSVARAAADAAATRYSTELSLELAVVCGVATSESAAGSAQSRVLATAVVEGELDIMFAVPQCNGFVQFSNFHALICSGLTSHAHA